MSIYNHINQNTKALIIREFWTLYQKSDISKITVTSITKKIGIHRATFYLYFTDIYDVLNYIEDYLLTRQNEICKNLATHDDAFYAFLQSTKDLFNQNKEFLLPLLFDYRDPEFALKYRAILRAQLWKDIGFKKQILDISSIQLIDALLNGLIETFLHTLQTGTPPS